MEPALEIYLKANGVSQNSIDTCKLLGIEYLDTSVFCKVGKLIQEYTDLKELEKQNTFFA